MKRTLCPCVLIMLGLGNLGTSCPLTWSNINSSYLYDAMERTKITDYLFFAYKNNKNVHE